MPEIKWGTADKVAKPPHVWKHADEPEWYFAVGVLSLVISALVIGLIWLAVIGIWVPLALVALIVVILAVIVSIAILADHYNW